MVYRPRDGRASDEVEEIAVSNKLNINIISQCRYHYIIINFFILILVGTDDSGRFRVA